MFCTVHVQCTDSARYSARHSARPQNAVNTTYFPKNNQKTQKEKIFLLFFCKLSTQRQCHGICSVLWPCTVACTVPCTVRALYVHCTCTVQNTVCAILLLEAWRHILCLWVAAVKMNVSLDWGCAPPLHPNCRTLAAHNFQRSSGRGPQSFPDCVSFVFWLPPSCGPPNASLFVSLAFICLPVCLVLPGSPDVSLYLPPFMCLVVCLYKCPALHLPPFTSNGRKPLGFNFQKLGGHRRFSLIRICTRGSGKLEALSPAVSPSIFPLCLPPCLSLC